MFYLARPDSAQRHRFLERTQSRLLENLDREPVSRALGTTVVQRLKMANDRLVIPNIRDGVAVMPRSARDSEAVPFIAPKPNETIQFRRSDLMPTPSQQVGLRGILQEWSGSDDGVSEVSSLLMRAMQRKTPAIFDYQLGSKSGDGSLIQSKARVVGSGLGLRNAPAEFFLKTRPVLGLAYKGGYRPDVVLAHELVHLDQESASPVSLVVDKEEAIREAYRYELEAYHHEANYITAIPDRNRLMTLWRYPDLAQHTVIESKRRELADPENPFEPTDALIAEIGRLGTTDMSF